MPDGLFKGIVPAVVTPFRADERIDYRVWQELIEALISSGVDGLLCLGGQGEFYALTEEEREVAARFAVQTADGRLPVYVNAGSNGTQESIRLAQQAEADGVDALVVITPYYVEPSPAELVDHYVAICHSVRIPVLAYNIPQRTRVSLTPAILGRVAAMADNFAGLKDSSGRVEDIEGYISSGLRVLIGLDCARTRGTAARLRRRRSRRRQRHPARLRRALRRLSRRGRGPRPAAAGSDRPAQGRLRSRLLLRHG